jgi:Bacterial Ig domain
MRYFRFAALAVAAPLALAALPASQAQSQMRDCMVSGNLAPIGFNSEGTIDLSSGESCNLLLNTSGTIDSSKISQRPKHGTLTMVSASNAVYKPKPGYKGTDEFAFTVAGRGLNNSGTSTLKIKANVN